MANIAALAVQLSANVSQFSASMKKAGGSVDDLSARFSAGVGSILKWGGALAGVGAAVTAFFTKLGADRIDNVAKLADRLGGSTEEIIGLQHAADLAGSSAEEMAGALEKLSRNLGDPSKEVVESVTRLGLRLSDLQKMSPAERMGKIADGLSMISSSSERAAIATDLFGKSGASLLNTLEGGSAGLRAAQEEAEKLGLTFNRIDAAKVERANDAITRMKDAFQGLFQKLSIQLAPFIETLADRIQGMGVAMQSAAPLIRSAFLAIADGIATVVDAIGSLDEVMLQAKAVALRIGGTVQGGLRSAIENSPGLIGLLPKGVLDAVLGDGRNKVEGAEYFEGELARRRFARQQRGTLGDKIRSGARGFLADADQQAGNDIAARNFRDRAYNPMVRAVRDGLRTFAGGGMIAKGIGAVVGAIASPIGRAISNFVLSDKPGPLSTTEVLADVNDRVRLAQLAEDRYGGSRVLASMFGDEGMPDMSRVVGSRGSFSAMGGRMVSSQTLQERTLDVAERQLDALEGIQEVLADGVPAP